MSRQMGDNWSPLSMAFITRLSADGLTGQEIADTLGCSRSRVIGKLWRMGIKLNGGVNRGFHKKHTAESKLKISEGMEASWRRRHLAMDRAEGLSR